MQIEAIGLLALACGFVGWFAGERFAIPAFFISTVLAAAAAIILPGLGGASIQPAHLLLGFLALAAVSSRARLRRAGAALVFPNPGFWLLLTAAYTCFSAIILPRIFAGTTYVFAIQRTGLGLGVVLTPLAPTSGNITQPIYFVGDLVCFLLFYEVASRSDGVSAIVKAAIAAAAINLCFAVIDVGSDWVGAGDVLSVIRNANYRILDTASVLGFKRVVGSYPEASTFAYYTCGYLAFCTKLALDGIRPRLTAPLAVLSFLALLFSTSSTGYAAGVGFLTILFLVSSAQALSHPVRRATLALVMVFPLVATTTLVGLRLNPPAWETVSKMFDEAVLNKMSSSSGVERKKWNDQALTNFSDTLGLGAGDGSVKASNFLIAVLGNIGIFGAVSYGIFLMGLFLGRKSRWQHPVPSACQNAARWACLTQLIGASVSGGFIDLGLPFFIFAAMACAKPEPASSPRVLPSQNPEDAVAA